MKHDSDRVFLLPFFHEPKLWRIMNQFKIITNQKNWMESTAINQLKHIAGCKGVMEAVGLPDLHAGVSPVGIAVITQDMIYPYLIGGDIGCSMGSFDTGIGLKKFKVKNSQKEVIFL